MRAVQETGQVLEVKDLSVDYQARGRTVHAVRDVTFSIAAGEVVGLAGESGCGKSTLMHAIAGMLPSEAAIVAGQARLKGVDTSSLSEAQLRRVRWAEVSIVPQAAMNSLSPVLRIGDQIVDAILAHEHMGKAEAASLARELLIGVGLSGHHVRSFPHELSGGMRQRAVIAMALALRPSLVLMDEPTTALDVISQRGILSRILALRARFGFSVVVVTHDLPLLMQVVDRVAVMYAGRIVEVGSVEGLRKAPRHPYTQALLRAFPALRHQSERLAAIPGAPPDLREAIPGCAFAPRCPLAVPYCQTRLPVLTPVPSGAAACHVVSGEVSVEEGAS